MYKFNKKVKKAFTLIELVIVSIVLGILSGLMVKTLFDVKAINIVLSNKVDYIKNISFLQSFFIKNQIDDIILIQNNFGKFYNKFYKKDSNYKELIDYIISDEGKALGIEKEINIENNGNIEKIYLPYFVFKTKTGNIGFLGFKKNLYNGEENGTYKLVLYYLKKNIFSENLDYNINTLYDNYKEGDIDYINKFILLLKKTSYDIKDNLLFVNNYLETNLKGNINYILIKDLKRSFNFIPTKNVFFENNPGQDIEDFFSDFLSIGKIKLYYIIYKLNYYSKGRIYNISFNTLIK